MDNNAVFAEEGRVPVSDCPDLSVKSRIRGILFDLRVVVTSTSLCETSVRDSSSCYSCHKFIVMRDNRNKILTVVFITICRCSLGWIFGCAERRGATECCIPVSEQRPMQRIKG